MRPETEFMKGTQQSGDKNSLDKGLHETVDNGKTAGSVLMETIAGSVTISISVQNWHSRIFLRVFSCGRMREMRREPEVPEARVQVVGCLNGSAWITSKELAPLHSVTSGILQNACSTRARVVADLRRKCFYWHRQVGEQPSKKVQKEWEQKFSSHVEEAWAES